MLLQGTKLTLFLEIMHCAHNLDRFVTYLLADTCN